MGQNLDFGYGMFSPADNRPVLTSVQDDGDVALLIRYVGAAESGTVEVAAGGDITLKVGVIGSEAVDTNVGLPTKNGVYDVSNAAADTLGEIVDDINAAADWEAVIVDGLRSDSSNNSLLLKTATQAKTPKGVQLLWDTDTVGFALTRLVAPEVFREDIRVYRAPTPGSNVTVKPGFPFAGTVGEVSNVEGVSTYVSGTSNFQFINADGEAADEKTFPLAAGATTAVATIDRTNYPFRGRVGGRLLVRLKNSAAMASARLSVNGALKRTFA